MKYVTRVTRAYWSQFHDEYSQSVTADEVIEADRSPRPIGLLDQSGRPLYRLPETVAFGFHGAKVR